ncbi:MAG: DUF6259 domain-containing protein [Anaerolineales bacterium]|jgi:hypothetical protein
MNGTSSLDNKQLSIKLGDLGGFVSLVNKQSGREFVADSSQPLYELALFSEDQGVVEISSLEAELLSTESSSTLESKKLSLSYHHHDSLDLNVTCTVELKTDSFLSYWWISVRNNTPFCVRAIRYPVLIAPATLGESDDDDYFAWGWLGGALEHRPSRKSPPVPRGKFRADGGHGANWFPLQYPGPIGLQMQAYYDDTAGLYMATYDAKGCVKSFGSLPTENGLDLTIEHNYDETPGLDFELPYPTVLGVFHGDWYTAADIYKAWALNQLWCTRKICERDDVPEWLKEPRPWLATIGRGNYARLQGILTYPPAEPPIGKFWPAWNVVPLMREYATLFETPVITWMEGWEKHGSPGGPVDIFPPAEGEENFKAAMMQLNRDGNLPFMYLAAFHWWYKRPTVGYDGWKRFEREGQAMAALDDQRNFIVNDIEKRPYGGGQGYYVSLCTGNQDMQDIILENFLKLLDLGGMAVSLDIQIGLYAYVCYSEEHGHTPGYGPWMVQETLKFLRRVRQEIKERNPKAALGYEIPCELWLGEVDFQYHRPYRVGAIPLFDYAYSAYACCLGGDVIMGICHPEEEIIKQSTIFIQGVQHLVGIGLPEYDFEVNPDYPAIEMLRNICKAERTFAHKYLVFGEMFRPTDLEVPEIIADLYRHPGHVAVPCILHSTWRAQDGDIGHVLVNWSGKPTDGVLKLVQNGNGQSHQKVRMVNDSDLEPVQPIEVVSGSIKISIPPRGVLLVEQLATD